MLRETAPVLPARRRERKVWSFVAKSSDSAGTARGGKGKPAQGQKKGGKTASRAPAKAPARPSAAAIRYQQQEEQRLRRNNQLLALLLFVLGIFLVALSIFDGPKVWAPSTTCCGASAAR